jgi:splicing factor 3B subunit 4
MLFRDFFLSMQQYSQLFATGKICQNKESAIYISDLSNHVTEDLLLKPFTRPDPVISVKIPRDKITNRSNGYGFVAFRTEQDVQYATSLMQGISLYGTPIRINTVSVTNDDEVDVGAKLYVVNLSSEVTDLMLHEIFKILEIFKNIVL